MKTLVLLVLTVGLGIGNLTSGVSAGAEKPLRVAFVYAQPVGVAWTAAKNNGRLFLEANMPNVVTAFSANVADADAARVIRGYAAAGFDVVVATSFGFTEPAIKVAADFPEVYFLVSAGLWVEPIPPNVALYFGRMYEPRYLAGMVAGLMTRTNKIGFIASFPDIQFVRQINAFTLGARAVNPEATVIVAWNMSWFDPPRETEAALAMADAGVDVITHGLSAPAIPAVAQRRGIHVIGHNLDNPEFAPAAHLTATVWNWGALYVRLVQTIREGRWTGGFVWDGLREDAVRLAPYTHLVPQHIREIVNQKANLIKQGLFHVFEGPIYGQDGTLMIPEGFVPSDVYLMDRMNWFVHGVVGKVP